MRRIELGVDGNCGFALLGDNLQSGESEFVEVEAPGGAREEMIACKFALEKLRKRLNNPELTYYLGESHPNHV